VELEEVAVGGEAGVEVVGELTSGRRGARVEGAKIVSVEWREIGQVTEDV